MKTLTELLALTDAERAMLFYRDVLGCHAHVPYLGGFVIVRPKHGGFVAIMNEVNSPGKMNRFDTEELAWQNVPPVSNEAWLRAMDEIMGIDFEIKQARIDMIDHIGESLAPIYYSDCNNSRSEALKRAVLSAAIYSKQQRA